MDHAELTAFFLALGVLLLFARIFGELARWLNYPAVLGEIIAGILLGPTVLGSITPELFTALFPPTQGFQIGLQAVTNLGITLFLMVAGIEVDLSAILRQGRSSVVISLFGIVIPFAVGYGFGVMMPEFFGAHHAQHGEYFPLFLGTALSITALPVIAKILIDLNIYRSDLGMLLISVAVIDDLIGWMLFAAILGLIQSAGSGSMSIAATIGITIGFAVTMLTLGRVIIDIILPRLQAYTTWPGGVLGFAIVGGLLAASFTEWIGIHSILGAFMFGVALGDSTHLREKTRQILDHFISFIFAPLFFASIGLKVNVIENFDPLLVALVLVIATLGKLTGCVWGAKLMRFSKRESLAIGVAMNARGAMEIILALLALQVGLIGEPMFVALITMAIITSLVAGPAMQAIMRRKRIPRLFDFINSKSFSNRLTSVTREEVIFELSKLIAPVTGLKSDIIAEKVLDRERTMPTGIGRRLAIPHARMEGLTAPAIALGFSRHGVDFDAPDGAPANIILLVLTPKDDYQIQLQILADIGRLFKSEKFVDKVLKATSFVEFLAILRSEDGKSQHSE